MPFAVIINTKRNGAAMPDADTTKRVVRPFAKLDKARNVHCVGRLKCEKLSDRNVFH